MYAFAISAFPVVISQQSRTQRDQGGRVQSNAQLLFEFTSPVDRRLASGQMARYGQVQLKRKGSLGGRPSLKEDRIGGWSENKAVEDLVPQSLQMYVVTRSGVKHSAAGRAHNINTLTVAHTSNGMQRQLTLSVSARG